MGDLREADLEEIVRLRPNLILISKTGNRKAVAEALAKVGLNVKTMERPNTVAGYADFIRELGLLTGREARARELSEKIRKEAARLQARTAADGRVRTFVQLDAGPVLYSAGAGTLVGDLLDICGGENIVGDRGRAYPALEVEEVIAAAPEVIVVCVMGRRGEAAVRDWARFPWVPAVAAGRIHLLDPDLICRLSPSLLQGMEQISKWLHPEESVP